MLYFILLYYILCIYIYPYYSIHIYVVGWRLINDRQLFGYFYTLVFSCLVGWGGVGWDNNVMSKCVSHVLAPWSSLPVGWGEEGWGGVGWGGVG